MSFKLCFDKNRHSEQNLQNQEITEKVATDDKSKAQNTPVKGADGLQASTLTSLDTLLDDITSSKEEWPSEALRKVLGRFGRMPRTGWTRTHSVYCGKFNLNVSLEQFKKKATEALTSKAGRKCSAREFKNEAVKRVKTLDVILEENTLFEAKVYNEAKKTYLECIQEVSSVEVDQVERTIKLHCVARLRWLKLIFNTLAH